MSRSQNPIDDQPFDISRMPSGSRSAPQTEHVDPTPFSGRISGRTENSSLSNVQWRGGHLDYVKLAHRYKYWIVCGLICGLLVGHLVYRKAGPEYTATAKILVSKRATGPIKSDGETETWGDRGEHIALIMSPLIVEKAVKLHALDELPSMSSSLDPVEDILDALKVQRSAGHDRSVLNVLDITVRNKRRDDAKVIVHAMIDAYEHYLFENHAENIGELEKLVTRATGDLKSQLDTKEAEYDKFRRAAPVHLKLPDRGPNGERISVQTNIHQESLDALDKQRQQILIRKGEIEGQMQSIRAALTAGYSREELAASIQIFETPQARTGTAAAAPQNSITVGRDPANPQASLDERLIPLLLQERQLLLQYGEEWPDVVAVRSQITTLVQFYRQRGLRLPGEAAASPAAQAAQQQLAGQFLLPRQEKPEPKSYAKTDNGLDVIDLYVLSLQQKLNSLVLHEQAIDRQYAEETTRAQQLAEFLKDDRRLNDEIDRLNGLWNSVQVSAQKFDIFDKENLGYSLKTIAPARDELSLKRVIKMYGVGVVAVLGLIGVLIFLREWQDTTLKAVDEVRESLPLPILGTVPTFPLSGARPNSPLQAALCYFHRPGSSEAEAYRSIRTALLVSLGTGQKIIQVTSPEPGDGKSTLISNLAIAMAQSGRRVLLIDSDLRRPTQHTLFGLRSPIGATDVLAGEIDVLTAAQQTVVDGLSVLTSGSIPGNPAELLSSRRYAEMLREAGREFDLVLVDTPPLLAVSDPCIAAQHSDGLILVLRISKNRRAAAKRATELLQTNNVQVIGVVCNGTDAESEGYGYRQTYGDYLKQEPAAAPQRPSRVNEKMTPVKRS